MGRGSTELRGMSAQAFGENKAATATQQGVASAARASLLPSIQEFQHSEGGTPEEQAAETRAGVESAAQPFADATQGINTGVARTRNAAGAAGSLEAAARDKSTAMSDAALKARQGITARKYQQREFGAQMGQQDVGQQQDLLARLIGLGPAYLGNYAQGISRTSFGLGPLSFGSG